MKITNQPKNQSFHSMAKFTLSAITPYLKYFLLPVLTASYPALFFYANNVSELLLINLKRTLYLYIIIAISVYIIFLIIFRRNPLKAANASFIFLLFINIYGFAEKLLIKLDWFPVHFFTTLPLILLLTFYLIWWVNKLNPQTAVAVWKISFVFVAGLVFINLMIIVPAEFTKKQVADNASSGSSSVLVNPNQSNPDIYYIVLDEFAGFPPMREYWKNPEVEDFIAFLTANGFTVYENSQGSSINTPRELASRLNYQNYSLDSDNGSQRQWFELIADNRAVKYLKQRGYTIVTFDEMQFAYPTAIPFSADVTYNYEDIPSTNFGKYFDDFGTLVADNTMINIFSPFYKKLSTNQHSDMVFFTATKIRNLGEITKPKFVYVHLLFPHSPFLFDGSGNINPPSCYSNYDCYLGNYNFSIYLTKQMVTGLIADSNLGETPIIILQSDHGLRNFTEEDNYLGHLDNYPEEYKTSILYALLLPGYEPTYSEEEMDPINTFPLIFNHLFDAKIPLQ